MYSHCTYKLIASGNNSHSEPANCPNSINSTLDPSSPCSNCLARLLHPRSLGKASTVSLQGSCRQGAPSHSRQSWRQSWGIPSQRGHSAPKEAAVPPSHGVRILVSTAWLPSLLGSTMGTPGTRAITGCSCCSDTSDCPSDTGRQSHKPGSKTGWIFHNSLSTTHHVWDTWVSREDPEPGLLLKAASQQPARHAGECPKRTEMPQPMSTVQASYSVGEGCETNTSLISKYENFEQPVIRENL